MGTDEREKALRLARAHEKRGDPESAAREYVRGGAPAEAVRVLTGARRYAQAAQVLIVAYSIQATTAAKLDAEGKRQALNAAILLGRGGETRRAVDLFVALGERERAAELLRRTGDAVGAARLERAGPASAPRATPSLAATAEAARRLEAEGRDDSALQMYLALGHTEDAARVAERLRRWPQAAQLYVEAGKPYEAAQCSLAAGNPEQAFDQLAKASREDPRYRGACLKTIAAAASAKALSYSLEHFLGPFVSSQPRDAAEAEAFYSLAGLYAEKELVDSAVEIYRRLLLFDARFRDASARLKRLTAMAGLLSEAGAREDLAVTFTPSPHLHEEATEPAAAEPAEPAPVPSRPAGGDAFVEGALIAQRYKLVNRIGKGGMAAVFRATDLELSIEVALKVYFPVEGNDDADMLARFRRELRFARSVIHPNVVRVFDIGVHQGQRYITMELLKGSELRSLFRRGPMPIPQALGYLVQVCAGLQAAHDQGIVHRDVKPANLFVTDEGVVKVMDFGIARVEGAPRELTHTGAAAGTPGYMAPEQIRDSSKVTPAADIYSVGVVAYRALTGVMPFSHPDMIPLLMMHIEQPPPPLREHNPFIPVDLEQVVLRCLAKQPQERWPSCTALGTELERLRRGASPASAG